MKKNMIKMLIGLGILFGSIFAFKVFQHYMMNKALAAQKNPVQTVSAIEAKYSEWQPLLTSTGSARTFKGVNVTTEQAGMIRDIYFKPGSYVKKGDLLVQLDIDSDIAQLKSLQAQARYAAITYKRNRAQYRIGAVSKEQLDSDESNYKSTAQQVIEQMANIAQKTIRAPFSGKLGISAVYPGQYINPGDKVVNLQTLDPVYVDFNLPQEVLSKIEVGQEASITVDTFEDKVFKGKITTINPEVDSSTRNVEVEATIDNPDHLLLPGMFTHVEIVTGKPEDKLTLPNSAIVFNSYGDIVYVLTKDRVDKDGRQLWKAKETFVVTAEQRGNQIALQKGVSDGDMIVTSGQLKIRSGSIVKINNSVTPSDNPNPQVTNE